MPGDPRLPGGGGELVVLADAGGDARQELVLAALRTNALSATQIAEIFLSRGIDWDLTIRSFEPGRGYADRPDARIPITARLTAEEDMVHLAGDLDGDGRKDLAVRRSPTDLEVFPGREGGYFAGAGLRAALPGRGARGLPRRRRRRCPGRHRHRSRAREGRPPPVEARPGRAAVSPAVPALSLEDLGKRFGRILAVDRLSLEVEPGRMAGFLGPNGAGKSTTLYMISRLVRPSSAGSGSAWTSGATSRRPSAPWASWWRPPPSTSSSPAARTSAGREPARRSAREIDGILDRVGLADRGGDKVRTYSLGMKQRLGIGRALLGTRAS